MAIVYYNRQKVCVMLEMIKDTPVVVVKIGMGKDSSKGAVKLQQVPLLISALREALKRGQAIQQTNPPREMPAKQTRAGAALKLATGTRPKHSR
jgi:hypothetical protein